MERTETQVRRKQWTKLQVQAKRGRDERVAHGAPSAQISRDISGVAGEEQREAEAQMFRERSMAILEQKNNTKIAKRVGIARPALLSASDRDL